MTTKGLTSADTLAFQELVTKANLQQLLLMGDTISIELSHRGVEQ